jgi:peptide/nickel transport system substrate-binding protein
MRQDMSMTGSATESGPMSGLLGRLQEGRLGRRSFAGAAIAAGMAPVLATYLSHHPAAAQEAGTGLVVTLPRTIVALDPHGPQAVEETTAVVSSHIHDTLTARNPETGEVLPRLAESWTQVQPTVWEFTLRSGVTFHDGSPFTSEDVKASLERIIALEGPLAPLWAGVTAVEAPEPQIVRITTETQIGTIPVSATLLFVAPAAGLVNPDFFNQPYGLGAFRFVSWQPDNSLEMTANPDYYGGAPALTGITIREIPEQSARATAMETGEIDFTYGVSPDQLPALRENADLTIAPVSSYRYYFVWFNATREPFTNPVVRRALIHALDLDTIVADLLADVAVRAQAPIPTTCFGAIPQAPYAYDPELAQSMLAEAGFPDGFETTIQWNPGAAPQDREIMLTMLAYWEAIGVRVENLEKERAVWLEDLLALNWDMNFQDNTVRTGDADFTLRRLYTSTANRTGYANPELDQILADAAASADPAERETLYTEACRIIWEDAVGIFPFDLIENYIHNNRVQGFMPAPNAIPTFIDVSVTG